MSPCPGATRRRNGNDRVKREGVTGLWRGHHDLRSIEEHTTAPPSRPPFYDPRQPSPATGGSAAPMTRWLRRLWRRGRQALQWVWQQEGSPGQRARGLAAGIFCGCFPFFGLQTLLGIALASVVRGNHLLAAAGTWISNPFTYVPLYWFNYHVGDVLLRGGAQPTAHTINQASDLGPGMEFHQPPSPGLEPCGAGAVAHPWRAGLEAVPLAVQTPTPHANGTALLEADPGTVPSVKPMGSSAPLPVTTALLAITPKDAKPRPWWITKVAASWILGASLSACSAHSPSLTPPLAPKDADLRLTEEPYQSQEAINQRMAIVIPYLERVTGLRIAYVPAINYAHSHQMLRDGEVDVINIGVMGGYRLPAQQP